MTVQQLTLLIITILYFAFILFVSFVFGKKAKTVTDFTVGGRNAGAWVSAFSYGTTYFSAVMFVGYSGAVGWQYGLFGILPGIGNAILGSFLAWLMLAKRTREVTHRLKIKSMPQFFEKRFNSIAMKNFSVALIFVFLLPYSASVYKGLSSVSSVLLQVDERVCMVVIAISAAAIVITGGYAATLKADFVQGFFMLIGIVALILAVMRTDEVGGLAIGIEKISTFTQNMNLQINDYISLFAMVFMTSLGSWALPQMIHKYYAIKNDSEVKIATIVSTFFALIVAGGGYFIGSLSHLYFTELPSPPSGGAGSVDYLVPNMLAIANIPTILIGIVFVLLIAASVSTLSSIVITATSTLTMDFLLAKNYISKQKSALVTKILCGVFVALSYFMATSNTPILNMMSYSWGIISGSFLAVYVLSLYWQGINKFGAWCAMLSGFSVASVPLWCSLFMPNLAVPLFGNVSALGAHFACLAMAVSFPVAVFASKFAHKYGFKSALSNESFYDKNCFE